MKQFHSVGKQMCKGTPRILEGMPIMGNPFLLRGLRGSKWQPLLQKTDFSYVPKDTSVQEIGSNTLGPLKQEFVLH